MRNLIEMSQDTLIKCDNPNCNYIVENKSKNPNVDSREYINKPCPKCGENLLTLEDYILYEKIIKTVNWINKWFSWLTIFVPKSKKPQEMSVHIHNEVKIEKK